MSVSFTKQLNFVELAVSTIFNNTHIGKCVQQIINEADFEDVNELLNDLNDINDSMILDSVSDTIKTKQNILYEWNKQNDEQKLHTILINIFKHNIIDINKLINNGNKQYTLPNTLIECNTQHILIIARNIIKSINKTAQKQININNVENMITNEKLNGIQISNITRVEFCKKCKPYKIAMGKAGKILNGIKEYKFEQKSMQITIEQMPNKPIQNEPTETETKVNVECKDKNDEIEQIIECDNKYILYIMNKYVFNDVKDSVKNEKLKEKLKLNKDKIMEFVKKNNLNGKQINDMGRRDWGSKVAEYCNNKTLKAIAMKIQKYTIEFDMKRICEEDKIKLNSVDEIKEKDRKDYTVSEFKECTYTELVYLLEYYIIDTLKHKKLTDNKDRIIAYFRDNKINGLTAIDMPRKEFINNLTDYCGDKKSKGGMVQLYKVFHVDKNAGIDIATVKLPISLKSNGYKHEEHEEKVELNEVTELKLENASTDHIIYVLHNHAFNEINNDKLSENKSEIIKYIRLNQINGQKIIDFGRKEFSKTIAMHCNDLTLNAPLTKVYKKIKQYKYNTIPNKIPINSLPLPSNIEECSVNELLFIINEEILPKIPKLDQSKNKINIYIKKNNINGAKFNTLNRSKFTKQVIAAIGVKNMRSHVINLYNKLNKFEFGQELRRNVSASSAASEIALSLTTEPLAPDISLVFHTPKRVKSSSSNISTDSASSYENLRCDVIALMAKDHATKALAMTHKKIQRSIDKNGVDGKQFMNIFDINDGNEFIEFFNHKVCGGKPKKGTNKKFSEFRKWLINEINESNVELKGYNILEMTQFVLDGYDEFIAHLFVLENINGHIFMTKDYRDIVAEICDKYGVPRGGITNLCHAIEDKLKNDVAKYSRNNVSKSKRWCSQKSTRFLPKIDWDEKLKDDDDVVDYNGKQNVKSSLGKLNMNEFIDMVSNIINDINMINSHNIDSGKLIKLFQTRQMNGRIFNFFTEKAFGNLLNNIGIKEKDSQLIYSKIKSYNNNNLNHNIDTLYEKKEPIEWSDSIVEGSDIIILSDIIEQINKDNNIKQKINKQILIECVSNNININKVKDLTNDKWINITKQCNISETISVLMLSQLTILTFKWNRKISKVNECSMDELLYVLCKYILPTINTSMANKNYIIKYIKMKDINGNKLKQLGVASFKDELGKQYKIPRGTVTKIYNQLCQFKYHVIIGNII